MPSTNNICVYAQTLYDSLRSRGKTTSYLHNAIVSHVIVDECNYVKVENRP